MPGFLKSEEPSGKREGLLRPCRFQPLCLLDAWPAASSPTRSDLPGFCLWGQLDVFSSWRCMSFSDFLGAKADLCVSLQPS